MKKIEITFGFLCSFMLTFLMFGMSLSLFAQEEAPTVVKKKIIVKKTIDEDGNENTETIETEVEVNLEDYENMEGGVDIDVDETIENGVRKKIVKVRVDDETKPPKVKKATTIYGCSNSKKEKPCRRIFKNY